MKKKIAIVACVLSLIMLFCSCGAKKAENVPESNEDTQNTSGSPDFFGLWMDSVSQRAAMTIFKTEKGDGYEIYISWAGSSSDASEWTMNAVFDSDKNILKYDDCLNKEVTYDENGNNIDEKIIYKQGKGYF